MPTMSLTKQKLDRQGVECWAKSYNLEQSLELPDDEVVFIDSHDDPELILKQKFPDKHVAPVGRSYFLLDYPVIDVFDLTTDQMIERFSEVRECYINYIDVEEVKAIREAGFIISRTCCRAFSYKVVLGKKKRKRKLKKRESRIKKGKPYTADLKYVGSRALKLLCKELPLHIMGSKLPNSSFQQVVIRSSALLELVKKMVSPSIIKNDKDLNKAINKVKPFFKNWPSNAEEMGLEEKEVVKFIKLCRWVLRKPRKP